MKCVLSGGSSQWGQDLCWVHEIAIWCPFPTVGYIAQPWNSKQGLGHASTWYTRLHWLPKERPTHAEEYMGWDGGGTEGMRRGERRNWCWYIKLKKKLKSHDATTKRDRKCFCFIWFTEVYINLLYIWGLVYFLMPYCTNHTCYLISYFICVYLGTLTKLAFT